VDTLSQDEIADKLADGCLIVDFCGELTALNPNEQLTFGREADLFIDDNRYLHRRLGRFENTAGHWWVANIGTKIDLNLYDQATRASAVVTPGTSQALTGPNLVVRFVAGRHTYELLVQWATETTVDTAPPSDTIGVDSISWTDEQRLLLTILAEDLLRNPSTAETFKLPTNQDARSRLGWSEAKFNRKLDNICERLTTAGVRGLEKGVNKRNNLRRRILATYVVHEAIVIPENLADLRRHEQDRQDH